MLGKKNTISAGSSFIEKLLLLTVFIVPLWPRYAMISIEGLPNINLTRVIIFALVMLWVITILGFDQYGQKYRTFYRENRNIVLVMVMLFSWRLLSVINMPKMKSVFILFDELFTWYLLSAVGVSILSNSQKIHKLLNVMLLSCLVITIVGLVEAYVGHNLFVNIFWASNEDVEQVIRGSYREHYRIVATFKNGLSLAEYLAFMLPVLIYGYVYSISGKIRLLSLITVLLAFLNIWLTESRGAWVVLVIMSLSFGVLYYRRKLKRGPRKVGYFILSVVVPILLILFFTGVFIVNEFVKGSTVQESQSSIYRLKQLETGLPLVLGRPMLGYGIGEAATVVGMIAKTVDNYYLTISLESGLPSLLLLLSILFMIIKSGYGIYMAREDEIGALAGVLATSIFGFSVFMSVLSLKEVFPLVFLTFSLLLMLKGISPSSQKPNIVTVSEGRL